jgi:hypothetical protein
MMESLISQTEAVKMLMDAGKTRTNAYNTLSRHLPTRTLVGHKVYSRIDVELLIAKMQQEVEIGRAHV